MRRTAVFPLLLALTLVTSGCLGVVTGDPITFEASPAAVGGDSGGPTHGFELVNSSDFTVTQNVSVPVLGQRQVRITNHVASYAKTEGEGQNASGAGIVLVSTPQAQVLGQATNPLGRVPLKELVERVGGRAGNQSEIRQVGTNELTVLGTTTTVEKYESTTRTKEGPVKTYVYVTRVPHDGDYIIAVGILPREFQDAESAVYAAMTDIEHPANP